MKYNIVLADDHKLFLEGLISLINKEKDMEVAYSAHTGKFVHSFITTTDIPIDLLITDISMPDMDGITLQKQVTDQFPQIKTLVVSMHMDAKMIDTLVQHNVDGYLSKNTDSGEFIRAIRTILKGEKYFSESVKQAYMDSVFKREKATLESLSSREKEVLKLIAQEHTTQEIADTLFLSKHTVESYRKTLITKLKVRNLAGLTKYAIRFGLIDG